MPCTIHNLHERVNIDAKKLTLLFWLFIELVCATSLLVLSLNTNCLICGRKINGYNKFIKLFLYFTTHKISSRTKLYANDNNINYITPIFLLSPLNTSTVVKKVTVTMIDIEGNCNEYNV